MRYMAPDGTPILGEHNNDFCAYRATWPAGAGVDEPDYSHSPDVEWATTVYDGCTVWLDEDIDEWLSHHLIPDDGEPLSSAAVAIAQVETATRKRAQLLRQVAETYRDKDDGWHEFNQSAAAESRSADLLRQDFEREKERAGA